MKLVQRGAQQARFLKGGVLERGGLEETFTKEDALS